MIQGNCVKCTKRKSQFVSKADAKKKGKFIFSEPAVVDTVGAITSLTTGASTIADSVNKKKGEDKK